MMNPAQPTIDMFAKEDVKPNQETNKNNPPPYYIIQEPWEVS